MLASIPASIFNQKSTEPEILKVIQAQAIRLKAA